MRSGGCPGTAQPTVKVNAVSETQTITNVSTGPSSTTLTVGALANNYAVAPTVSSTTILLNDTTGLEANQLVVLLNPAFKALADNSSPIGPGTNVTIPFTAAGDVAGFTVGQIVSLAGTTAPPGQPPENQLITAVTPGVTPSITLANVNVQYTAGLTVTLNSVTEAQTIQAVNANSIVLSTLQNAYLLAPSVSSGDTVLLLPSTQGFIVGQYATISGGGTTETQFITGVGSNFITTGLLTSNFPAPPTVTVMSQAGTITTSPPPSPPPPPLLTALPPFLPLPNFLAFLGQGSSPTVVQTDKTPQSRPNESTDLAQMQTSQQITADSSRQAQLFGRLTFFDRSFAGGDSAGEVVGALPAGKSFLYATENTRISTAFGDIVVRPGTAVLFVKTDSEIAVLNLHDSRHSSVTYTLGGTMVPLPVGRQIVVTTRQNEPFHRINPSPVAYRNPSETRIAGNRVFHSEFSPLSALLSISSALKAKKGYEEISWQLLKTAAAMYVLGMGKTKPPFKPGQGVPSAD